ncbi:MAG: GNAT family N-acetyltransferase [Phycisphaerales bacterium]|nr:GNAT family N-acetyltransferase [Phycisphaerales bacterium]
MNAEDVIECRVLTGFHCLPFAQYTTPHTNRRCEHEAGMTMIGASIGGRPVGLAVFSCQNDSEKASLESIFVHPDARRRGIGRGLLKAVHSTLVDMGAAEVGGTWFHDAPSAGLVERLLADSGWSDPVSTAMVHHCGRRILAHVDQNNRAARLPAGFAFDSWANLSSDERARVDELRETQEIPFGLHPNGESTLPVSPKTTTVLRHEGDIVGWMIHHELTPEMLRYSSLWLRPDLVGGGLGISVAIESARRHLALADQIPRLFFMVMEDNHAMHRFIARRLQPGLDRSSILMDSSKALIPASSDEK